MPATTPILQLPYPVPDDSVDVPRDVQALAEAIESHGAFIVGELRTFALAAAPAHWLVCDGRVVLRADYPELFAAISTLWNTGGETTAQFRLPPVAGRSIIGAGAGAGLTNRAVAALVGEERHRLIVAELPSHNHGGATGNASGPPLLQNTGGATAAQAVGAYTGDALTAYTHGHTIGAQGGDGLHENMQPSIAMLVCVYAGR